jgi:hypothetical protein
MKRLAAGLAVMALAGIALDREREQDATRTICHRTSSKNNPYVKLRSRGTSWPRISSMRPTSTLRARRLPEDAAHGLGGRHRISDCTDR